jgi:hypothetical protein
MTPMTAASNGQGIGNSAKIALVSFDSLGDGLIYLMMAGNLQRNGFDVTCYGNVAHQMRVWLPKLSVRPYPPAERLEAELAQYDLAIVSPPRFVRERMDEATIARLREKWLLICQKTPESWRFDHTERVRRTYSPDKFGQLSGLLGCSGSIRFRKCSDESVVAMTLQFMREKMHLADVTKEPPIVPPPGLVYRRHLQRVIISPDSAGPEKKDWRPASFLKLCHELKKRGHTPEIVVAPKNHATWAKMAGNNFDTPRFDDVGELCAHLYESGVVVANDSGNGHLASFLGIPVVTIYRKRNPLFHWRPDWKRGIVICPALGLSGQTTFFWKHFIRPSQIVAAVEQLQGSNA